MIKRIIVTQILIGCFYSIVLFAILYNSAWQNLADETRVRPRQFWTLFRISNTINAIEEYRTKFRKLPVDLKDQELAKLLPWFPESVSEKGPQDPWGHPLHYEVTGDKFRIESYGRDGQPGGEGLDGDFGGPAAPNEFQIPVERPPKPTFSQFWNTDDREEIDCNSVRMWALFSVICVFGILAATFGKFWWLVTPRQSRRIVNRLLMLPEHSGEPDRSDIDLLHTYNLMFAAVNPGADFYERVGSILRFFVATTIMVFVSFYFGVFITLLQQSGH